MCCPNLFPTAGIPTPVGQITCPNSIYLWKSYVYAQRFSRSSDTDKIPTTIGSPLRTLNDDPLHTSSRIDLTCCVAAAVSQWEMQNFAGNSFPLYPRLRSKTTAPLNIQPQQRPKFTHKITFIMRIPHHPTIRIEQHIQTLIILIYRAKSAIIIYSI